MPLDTSTLAPEQKSRIEKARSVIKENSKYFKDNFKKVKSNWKEDLTRVTEADLTLSNNITAQLKEVFPIDCYCSEELADDIVLDLTQSQYTWILDPIDGTNNYALGITSCCISLGLFKDGYPIYGILYDFSRDTIIEGGKDFGTFIEDQQVQVKSEELGKRTLMSVQTPLSAEQLEILSPLLSKYSIRSLGSGALNLAYVAAGIVDGSMDLKVKIWDIAAALPILEGSGGEFHFLKGSIFPLKEFHVKLPRCPFYAGSTQFCQTAEPLAKNLL